MALKYFLVVLFINHITSSLAVDSVGFNYHNYDNLTRVMKSFAEKFPDKTYLYSIGKSVEGFFLFYVNRATYSQPYKD